MLGKAIREPLCVRANRWQLLCEVPYVAGQDGLTLFVHPLRNVHPIVDDSFSSSDKLRVGRFAEVAVPVQLSRHRHRFLAEGAGVAMVPGAEEPFVPLSLIPAADDARRRVGGNPLLSHHAGEVLAPFPEHRLVDIQALSVVALGLHDEMDMGVSLVGVE